MGASREPEIKLPLPFVSLMRNLLLAAALLLFTTACSPANTDQSVEVTGRVTRAGQPLHVNGREIGTGMVQIGFWAIAADGKQSTQPWEAVVAADGRFRLHGRDGHGIPPGKYRISIRQWDPYPGTDKL